MVHKEDYILINKDNLLKLIIELKNPKAIHLFEHFLLEASEEKCIYKGCELERGELLKTIEALSIETGLTIEDVRSSIDFLKNNNKILIKKFKNFFVFSLKNYDFFVGNFDENTKEKEG